MSTYVTITSHDTEATLYESLSKVFGENDHNGTRWVALKADGTEIKFFAPKGA